MEHYKELIELRKKYIGNNNFILHQTDPEMVDDVSNFYPASNIYSLFKESFSQKEENWFVYENEAIINRSQIILPRPIIMSLKSYIFLIDNDSFLENLITFLYSLDAFNPITCYVPIDSLPENIRAFMMKKYRTLLGVEASFNTFAMGVYNNKMFTFCSYHKIDKNVARVLMENNRGVVCCKVKNQNVLYFDPMLFEIEELEYFSNKISEKLKTKTILQTDYDNYNIAFLSDKKISDIFNLINEEDELMIRKTQTTMIKPKINKPVSEKQEIEPEIIEIKPKFSGRFKKK